MKKEGEQCWKCRCLQQTRNVDGSVECAACGSRQIRDFKADFPGACPFCELGPPGRLCAPGEC